MADLERAHEPEGPYMPSLRPKTPGSNALIRFGIRRPFLGSLTQAAVFTFLFCGILFLRNIGHARFDLMLAAVISFTSFFAWMFVYNFYKHRRQAQNRNSNA